MKVQAEARGMVNCRFCILLVQLFGYCMDVLVPEVVLRMYMADQGVDYDMVTNC